MFEGDFHVLRAEGITLTHTKLPSDPGKKTPAATSKVTSRTLRHSLHCCGEAFIHCGSPKASVSGTQRSYTSFSE